MLVPPAGGVVAERAVLEEEGEEMLLPPARRANKRGRMEPDRTVLEEEEREEEGMPFPPVRLEKRRGRMEKDKGWVVASAMGMMATRSRRTAAAAQVGIVVLLLLLLPWPVVWQGVTVSARRLSCGAMLAAARAAAAAKGRREMACRGGVEKEACEREGARKRRVEASSRGIQTGGLLAFLNIRCRVSENPNGPASWSSL